MVEKRMVKYNLNSLVTALLQTIGMNTNGWKLLAS